ncbi:oxysterol-binding protein-related protein 1-like [Paramacrobiotus metropolitanus]|uniref:oxysterol-binding protein-related protein 1-like n=1 Tax=Paramacrobiotus metropolitanus TaxID=2943436 RepID=UPI0024458E6F|nr:oxysterol-binding protein-related protein 1-like [Paramacrobiotus metropolitanus]
MFDEPDIPDRTAKPLSESVETPMMKYTDAVVETADSAGEFSQRVASGKVPLDEALIYHARIGNTTAIREMLANKTAGLANLNINHLGTLKWNRDCSALHVAAYFGHLDVIKLLISEPDIDLNLQNNHSETALHKAALTGRSEIVRLLLANEANSLIPDDTGKRPSDTALNSEIRSMIKDAEQAQKCRQRESLFHCCRTGNVQLLRTLLDSHHAPNVADMDTDGNTALHHAVRHDQREVASLLMRHGSNPNTKNFFGKSSFDLVVSEPMQKILEIRSPSISVPTCEPFEGVLSKCNRIWNIWRRYWVHLHNGTISFYRARRDVGNEHMRKIYRHLDGSVLHKRQRDLDFAIRFSDGTTFFLRIPRDTEAHARESWMQHIEQHIVYSNHYVGLSDLKRHVPEQTLHSIEKSFVEAKIRLADLQKCLTALRSGHLWEHQNTHNLSLLDIYNAAERSHLALQLCFDMMREQERIREKQLAEERERCRVLENALQVLATEHDAVLNSMEHISSLGNVSSAGSVYFSPPESLADVDDEAYLDDNQSVISADDEFRDAESLENMSVGPVQTKPEHGDNGTFSTDVHAQPTPNGAFGDEQNMPARSKFGGRTSLPVPQFSRNDFSIWSVLKQCIGKDLSKITMPVVFNEPLSFLQRMSEYMEYAHLLDQAATCDDPVDRILYVTAFAISSCASNADRIGKPFNPLLGETFELSRPELGYRMICEQVCHHPPVSAFDASAETWRFYGSILPKLKFWGKSVEIQPKGTVTVELKKYKEVYSWSNVNLQVNNIIVGKLWIEQYGTMEIINHTTGLSCIMTFHPAGWSNKDLHRVNGYVVDKSKRQVRAVFGKWTEYLLSCDVDAFERFSRNLPPRKRSSFSGNLGRRLSSSKDSDARDQRDEHGGSPSQDASPVGHDPMFDIPGAKILWQLDPRPLYCSKYYGFSLFAMGLNELDPEMRGRLAPTDCRYRPDMRALENGDLDGASEQKNRLEEKQRAVRKAGHSHKRGHSSKDKEDFTPMWFSMRKNPHHGIEDWMSNDKYWDRDYSTCPDIY